MPPKKTERKHIPLDDLFTTAKAKESAEKVAPRRYYAVKQTRGPKDKQFDSLVVHATDACHARTTWFNYYGLHEQTYRYALEVVQIGPSNPLAKQAIQCDNPQVGGPVTVDQMAAQAFEDQQQMLKTGEAKIVETM